MEELKENISYKEVELLSEEVQEVMNRIPSAIVRWGMTVMAIIVVGMLIVAAYVPWPRTMEYPFEGHHDGAKALINVTLTDEEVRVISHAKHRNVTLYSPMLSDEFTDNGLSGIITDVSVRHHVDNEYNTELNIKLLNTENRCDTMRTFSGNILLFLSENTLFQRITKHIRDRKK